MPVSMCGKEVLEYESHIAQLGRSAGTHFSDERVYQDLTD